MNKVGLSMVRTIVSVILYPVAVTVFLVGAAIYIVVVSVIPSRNLHPLVRVLSRLILLSSGQILITEGNRPSRNDGPNLYLFNHESLFDVFMLGAGIPHFITAVGANKQFSWPVWGVLIKRYGIIPIKRKNREEAINSLTLLEDAIRNGTSCILAPEGTRTLTGQMGPFKKGPFHVALNTGVTIIPVGLIGAFEAKSKNDWRLKPGILTLRFGNSIYHDDFREMTVEELRDNVREKIVKLRG